jgi:aspartyl-tRNA(Asn)/glutamyl-tRNA(Gln) amidotransferase subunit C
MITEDDFEKLASLARLDVDPSMKGELTEQVGSILGYVQKLDDVDTADAQAMSHTHEAINVLREDKVHPVDSQPPAEPLTSTEATPQAMLSAEDMLQNTPDNSGRFIRVPLIVE